MKDLIEGGLRSAVGERKKWSADGVTAGTKPERNAAAEPLTEADAAAFPVFRRDERAGNDEGGPERH